MGNSTNRPLDTRRLPTHRTDFSYLDQEEFRTHYQHPDHPGRMYFYVEGVHCTSCLWRIENLKHEVPGISGIRLDMSRHLLSVDIEPGESLARIALELKSLGYIPRPVPYSALGDSGRSINKSLLIKLGIAAASAGNIMLLTTSLYSGAQHSEYRAAFEWLTFALFLPVLLYAAIPFYRNSYAALRNRRSSIDVPIAAAVIIGSVVGIYHLIVGRGDIYFDSLAVLVFLLLASRYLLYSLQTKFLAPTHLSAFYETNRVRVRNPESGVVEERHVSSVKWGDTVVVYEGERIPVDGTLLTKEAYINAAVLTGEPRPQRLLHDQKVFAGTELASGEALISVEKTGHETRMGKLLEETERGVLTRTPLVSLTDTVAQWFSASVLVLGVLFAVMYSFVNVHDAINRALALVILACPCALALATPLTQSLALKKASRGGCLIKKAEAFEKLHHIKSVFFDKTGTLTRGELVMHGWWPSEPDRFQRGVVVALERGSQHPLGRVLAADAASEPFDDIAVEERTETPGVGVSGYVDGTFYELRSLKDEADAARAAAAGTHSAAETTGAAREVSGAAHELDTDASNSFAGLYRDGELLLVARLGDTVRDSAREAVETLRTRGKDVHLLTGDAAAPARAVAAQVGIDAGNVWAARSPEEKKEILLENKRAMMVGDGVNDSVALANAHVSVAVQGSMETSFRAADIYLTQPGLSPLTGLFDLSNATISIIKRNLLFSLIYNTVGGALALTGVVTPLLAAVLMPMSSVTVVLSSVIGNRAWRSFGRFKETAGPAPAAIDPELAPKGSA